MQIYQKYANPYSKAKCHEICTFDLFNDMKVLILPDINVIVNILIDYRDTKNKFVFSITTHQELSSQKYDVGYFYITSEDITIYNSIYHLFHKIVSLSKPNLRKYILSADFIIIPQKDDLFVTVKRFNYV